MFWYVMILTKKLVNQNFSGCFFLGFEFGPRRATSGGPPLLTRRGPNSKPREEHPEPETATWWVLASGCVVSSTPDFGRSLT